MTIEQFVREAVETDETVLLANGFESCFVGIARQFTRAPVAVYDRDACIQLLQDRDGMTEDEAIEFFEFNVAGAWCGEQTPTFLTRYSEAHRAHPR